MCVRAGRMGLSTDLAGHICAMPEAGIATGAAGAGQAELAEVVSFLFLPVDRRGGAPTSRLVLTLCAKSRG